MCTSTAPEVAFLGVLCVCGRSILGERCGATVGFCVSMGDLKTGSPAWKAGFTAEALVMAQRVVKEGVLAEFQYTIPMAVLLGEDQLVSAPAGTMA